MSNSPILQAINDYLVNRAVACYLTNNNLYFGANKWPGAPFEGLILCVGPILDVKFRNRNYIFQLSDPELLDKILKTICSTTSSTPSPTT